MKALLITAVVFFSLRAMSSEVGEDQKSPCPYANQSSSRDAKVVVEDSSADTVKPVSSSMSK